jgi:hypothetical protein
MTAVGNAVRKANRAFMPVLAAAWLVLLSGPAAMGAAQIPDLSRGGASWIMINGKNFEPPPPGSPGAAGPIGNHPDYPSFGNQSGRTPTKRIGNDTSPLLKPWAAEQMRKLRLELVAGATPFDPAERCWPPGVPSIMSFPVEPMVFLQTPQEVVILYQRGQIARHIYLNAQHSRNPKASWHGESVGRYEGDTLVIDTIGLNDKTFVDVFNVPHTAAMHVVERYRIVGSQLQGVVTVEDPGTFTQPWSAMKNYAARTDSAFEESICQEGALADRFNQGLSPVPIADKTDF